MLKYRSGCLVGICIRTSVYCLNIVVYVFEKIDRVVQKGDRVLKYFQVMKGSAKAANVSRYIVDDRGSSGLCLQ